MDVGGIEPGTDFTTAIADAVGRCEVMLTLIGPRWMGAEPGAGTRSLDAEDDYVVTEVAAALEREIRVIPVLIDGAPMPRVGELPERIRSLARRNALTLDTVSWSSDLEALLAVLGRLMATSSPAELSPDAAPRAPSGRPDPVASWSAWPRWAAIGAAVAGLLVGVLVLRIKIGGDPERTAPSASSLKGLPDCYSSTVSRGVPPGRQIAVEEGTSLLNFFPGDPMGDPIVLALTLDGRNIGALRVRYYPGQVKKIEVAVDATCRAVEGYKNFETKAATDSYGIYEEICLPVGGTTYRVRVNPEDEKRLFILELEQVSCG